MSGGLPENKANGIRSETKREELLGVLRTIFDLLDSVVLEAYGSFGLSSYMS